jgi:hypothetical protein
MSEHDLNDYRMDRNKNAGIGLIIVLINPKFMFRIIK